MIDFLKYRLVCGIFSLVLFGIFIYTYVHNKQTRGSAFSYSVEFVGGTQILLKFAQPVSSNQVKEILEDAGLSGVTTRDFSDREIVVRVKEVSTEVHGLSEKIQTILHEKLPDNPSEILKTDSISQSIGEALSKNSMVGIVIALILMLLYISFRFWSFAYAIGAVVALFHDAFVMLLFFLLFDKDISNNAIMAILAVLGYSINDTIVIFARIRDNVRLMPNKSIEEIVNLSINQTLRRTILTSFATALVVVALLVLGGETIRDLSAALLIGIVFGTYSSIYIASPVMLLFYKKQ
jgi:preprotein translocase subunit SecF